MKYIYILAFLLGYLCFGQAKQQTYYFENFSYTNYHKVTEERTVQAAEVCEGDNIYAKMHVNYGNSTSKVLFEFFTEGTQEYPENSTLFYDVRPIGSMNKNEESYIGTLYGSDREFVIYLREHDVEFIDTASHDGTILFEPDTVMAW